MANDDVVSAPRGPAQGPNPVVENAQARKDEVKSNIQAVKATIKETAVPIKAMSRKPEKAAAKPTKEKSK